MATNVHLIREARDLVGKLSADEKAALRALKPDQPKSALPAEHEDRLVELGLARRRSGGLALTPLGQLAARLG